MLRRRRTIAPPAGARSELEVFAELARRLGARRRGRPTPPRCSTSWPRIRGWDRGLLRSQPRHPRHRHRRPLAVPGGSAGTPRLFRDRFGHPDGRARLVPVRPTAHGAGAAGVGPVRSDELTLVTGRLLEHYQSGAQTRRVRNSSPRAAEPQSSCTRIPRHGSASRWAISSRCVLPPGLPSDRGRHRRHPVRHRLHAVPLPRTRQRKPGHVADVDPISAMPEFKRTTVTIRRVDADRAATPRAATR